MDIEKKFTEAAKLRGYVEDEKADDSAEIMGTLMYERFLHYEIDELAEKLTPEQINTLNDALENIWWDALWEGQGDGARVWRQCTAEYQPYDISIKRRKLEDIDGKLTPEQKGCLARAIKKAAHDGFTDNAEWD